MKGKQNNNGVLWLFLVTALLMVAAAVFRNGLPLAGRDALSENAAEGKTPNVQPDGTDTRKDEEEAQGASLQTPEDAIRLVVATDLHFLSPKLNDHGAFFKELTDGADGKVMEYSEELMDAFVYEMLEKRPDLIVLTGDLTFNGALQSHIDLIEKLDVLRDAGLSVLVIPGNHDLSNPNAIRFEGDSYTRVATMMKEYFPMYYTDYGYTGAVSYDPSSLSYVWEYSPDLWLVMLDVNGVPFQGYFPEESLLWLEEELKEAKAAGARVLAFSHQNLLQHSRFSLGYVIYDNDRIIRLYQDYGVIANFGGHIHIQHIDKGETGFCEMITSSMAVSPNHYADLTLTAAMLTYQTASVDVEGWAAATGQTNPDLLRFSDYSETYFKTSAIQKAAARMELTQENEELLEWYATLNHAYFAGRLDTVAPDAELLARWREAGGVLGSYVESMANGTAVSQNTFVLAVSE